MRRRKSFTPAGIDQLEDRLTLSSLVVHHAVQVRHHHHHAAQVRHHHHHAAHVHNQHSGSVLPGAATTSPAPATNPTTPTPDPTASPNAPTAPTTGSSTPAPNPPAPGVGIAATTIALSGQVEGKQPLDGSGTVGPLGAVSMRGTLSASGAEPMNYSGTVTLVGSSVSVTLSLSGRVFGPVSLDQTVHLTYTITGGTGAYHDATGSGDAVLSFHLSSGMRTSPPPPPYSFVLTFS